MLGAIIGDIVGSAYEFNPTNEYNFEMFKAGSSFTDDTICTIAIADALLKNRDYGESLHDWCRRYMKPKGGFGGRFRQWVESDYPVPYGSYGNGSAMRVSPIAMWFSSRKTVEEQARKTAACTHNHPWGIKGAQATAVAGFLARKGLDGETVSAQMLNDYCDGMSVNYLTYQNRFDETCQGTIPPALDIIRQSTSFEDALRRAVSLGADADTLGAIVGGIAEHIWGVPVWMKEQAMRYLTPEMQHVVIDFYTQCDLRERTSPERIDYLEENEIFVFGSNMHGFHMGGAANAAMRKFGAIWGQGDGLQGKSYAISTMEGLASTAVNVSRFISFAASHPEMRFLVTAIGCGIAGYSPEQIAPLFSKAQSLKNVCLPASFWSVLGR